MSVRPTHALQLGRGMRFRLLTAVRALLADSRLVGRKDVVRLGLLVLMAKAAHGSCRVEITARELGRWLGVSESTVDHEVLVVLRDVEAVTTRVPRGEDGLPTGLEYRVEALWGARNEVAAPLALSKPELATLLRFVEGLFAPGWGEQCATPPGLLARKGRRGRGAASDRLALLLLALHARADGRVPLVGGPLAKSVARFGRAAVTLARMLGCRVPVAARVLSRLVAAEVVTDGSGQLVVPAVAAAHGSQAPALQGAAGLVPPSPVPEGSAGVERCVRCAEHEEVDALVVEGDGWRQLSWEDLESGVEGVESAPGDLKNPEHGLFAGQPVFSTSEASRVAADLHTTHAAVVDVSGEGAGTTGFSGEAASGYCRQPQRAREGRDSTAFNDGVQVDVTAVSGGVGPLRGEKHSLPLGEGESGSSAAASTLHAWRTASGGPPPVWAGVPKGLEHVLEPVAMVWGRLERLTTRRYLTRAVRIQLGEISGACGPEVDAQHILRQRLQRRLAEQGTVTITDPVGWLIRRGLPRRSLCPDRRCDEGRRMDTRADCAACQLLFLDARALRTRAAAKARTAVVGGRVSRPEFEAQLRACWQQEAVAAAVRHAGACREREASERMWAAQRAANAAQAAARQALACRECGMPETAGLCGRCREERRVEELVAEAVEVSVAAWGAADREYQVEVTRRAEREMRQAVARSIAELITAGGGARVESVALAARLAAELQLGALRRRAVGWLAYQGPAQAEFERVLATELRRGHHNKAACERASSVAQQARLKAANAALDERLCALRSAARQAAEVDAEPHWYARAAAEARALISPAPRERPVSVRRSKPSPGSTAGDSRPLAEVGA